MISLLELPQVLVFQKESNCGPPVSPTSHFVCRMQNCQQVEQGEFGGLYKQRHYNVMAYLCFLPSWRTFHWRGLKAVVLCRG